jgi:hypothetical protein
MGEQYGIAVAGIYLEELRKTTALCSLPEMCPKHCVRVATANPVASAVARVTDEVGVDSRELGDPPAPNAAPQTMKT